VKYCILVVEDNQLNRELLRDWLALTTDRPYRKALPPLRP
jgi:CheY-like chemotaxis protein